uniref:Uncharacterized protein n=1 Tax=Arundo donax TaxID=35708 RepID=A0A0A9CU54_ARUDO
MATSIYSSTTVNKPVRSMEASSFVAFVLCACRLLARRFGGVISIAVFTIWCIISRVNINLRVQNGWLPLVAS